MVSAERDQTTGNCPRWVAMGVLSTLMHVALIAILVGSSEPARTSPIESEDESSSERLAPGVAASEVVKSENNGALSAAGELSREVRPRQLPPRPLMKAAEPKTGSYLVKQGDTLIKLAREYGLTPEELAKLNGKETKRFARLWVGQRIKVPVQGGE